MGLLDGNVALITGASRGIGASVARQLAAQGADIVINYRSKGPRAEQVAADIAALGRRVLLAQADIVDAVSRAAMYEQVTRFFGQLDLLILNASGGLEKDRATDYAMLLNRDAQSALLDGALPLMAPGSRVVFVTSHMAHFYGQKPVYPHYEPVAASKFAGEQLLRARLDELAARGVSMVIVSGDMIEGTITPRLMQRAMPGLIEGRRQQAGDLPSVDEFAAAIVAAAGDANAPSGATFFVGNTD